MTSQTKAEAHDGYICPECGNIIHTLGSSVDHHTDCPVVTNWWTVLQGGELLCYLCDEWVTSGEQYRLIPQFLEADDHDSIEDAIGRPRSQPTKPVCGDCCTLRPIRSKPRRLSPTPTPISR